MTLTWKGKSRSPPPLPPVSSFPPRRRPTLSAPRCAPPPGVEARGMGDARTRGPGGRGERSTGPHQKHTCVPSSARIDLQASFTDTPSGAKFRRYKFPESILVFEFDDTADRILARVMFPDENSSSSRIPHKMLTLRQQQLSQDVGLCCIHLCILVHVGIILFGRKENSSHYDNFKNRFIKRPEINQTQR